MKRTFKPLLIYFTVIFISIIFININYNILALDNNAPDFGDVPSSNIPNSSSNVDPTSSAGSDISNSNSYPSPSSSNENTEKTSTPEYNYNSDSTKGSTTRYPSLSLIPGSDNVDDQELTADDWKIPVSDKDAERTFGFIKNSDENSPNEGAKWILYTGILFIFLSIVGISYVIIDAYLYKKGLSGVFSKNLSKALSRRIKVIKSWFR